MWNYLVKIAFRCLKFPVEQNLVDAKSKYTKLEDLRVQLIHELMIVDEKIELKRELDEIKKFE